VLSFAAAIALLTAAAIAPRLLPHRLTGGLPDDPDVRAACARFPLGLPLATSTLRFRCALGNGHEAPAALAPANGPAGATSGAWWSPALDDDDLARLEAARVDLVHARARRPGDVRIDCALAHLDLAARRFERAERGYRAVLDRVADYGEARMGLGLALAARAATGGGRDLARALRLEAIAQFAAIGPRDPDHALARDDRIVLLRAVGLAAGS
jgi:hypothetical protein